MDSPRYAFAEPRTRGDEVAYYDILLVLLGAAGQAVGVTAVRLVKCKVLCFTFRAL